ncbi:MAG: blue (type 1) copper domain protein [Marmoricola sp.]|nr:blue (type 1) copper domain protein [Marmoricola sp.]
MNTRRSRKIAAAGAALVALTVLSACGSSSSSPAGSNTSHANGTTVTTKLLSFTPMKLTVKAGTKVTWTDSDSIAHTVTTGTFVLGSDGLRSSQHPDGLVNMPLSMGKDVSYTFTKPGKYVYYCSIHHGMNGEIDVTP